MMEIGEIFAKCQTFEWAIDDFFFYAEKSSECAEYSSPDFYVGHSDWYMTIYPNRMKRDSKKYFSIFLHTYEEDTPKTVEITIGIKSLNNSIDLKVTGYHTFSESNLKWGCEKYVKTSELLKRRSELVPSDTLTITCFLRMKKDLPDLESRYSKLAGDLKDLFVSKEITDVTLRVKGHSFEAHRVILAARSPVFASMFISDTLEKETGVVKISDADPDAFNEFLSFLYSGEIEFSKCSVCELYKIAHKYDIPDLKSVCISFMIGNLSMENFYEMLVLSHKFEEQLFIAQIQCFFNKNFEKIVSSHTWETFLGENCRLCNSLLKSMAPKIKIID